MKVAGEYETFDVKSRDIIGKNRLQRCNERFKTLWVDKNFEIVKTKSNENNNKKRENQFTLNILVLVISFETEP